MKNTKIITNSFNICVIRSLFNFQLYCDHKHEQASKSIKLSCLFCHRFNYSHFFCCFSIFRNTKYVILLILSKVSKTLCVENVQFMYNTFSIVCLANACVWLKAIKELLNIAMRDEKLRSHWPKNNHHAVWSNPFTPYELAFIRSVLSSSHYVMLSLFCYTIWVIQNDIILW